MSDATTTRRRFLAACAVDETVTTPPLGYTCEWQLREDGGEWITAGYGETFTIPALDGGLYWVRTMVTMIGVGDG